MTQWEEVTAKAAISVLPKCIETIETVLMRGYAVETEGKDITEKAATLAVDYAESLTDELKRRFLKEDV